MKHDHRCRVCGKPYVCDATTLGGLDCNRANPLCWLDRGRASARRGADKFDPGLVTTPFYDEPKIEYGSAPEPDGDGGGGDGGSD